MSTFGKSLTTIRILAAAVCLTSAATARAGCTIDFENLPLGTAVSNQYPGVAFSVQPATWGGIPLYMRIKNPDYGPPSSGANCLKIDPDGGGASSGFLIMVFTSPQRHASYTVGDLPNIYYTSRYYRADGTQIGVQSVLGGSSVRTLMNITSTASDIKRIEVEAQSGNFEAIDDLTFDAGPPIAELSSPGFGTYFCGTSVPVYGRECVEDGTYGADVLEYMSVYGTTWRPVMGYTNPACAPNSHLYDWPVASVPDGTYYLRITVTNKCGLSTNALTVVTLHRAIDAAMIRTPVAGFIIGGTVCIDGSAHDSCFSHYAVEKKPVAGGSFAPVDASYPTYAAQVYSDPLAAWNTVNNTTPDGDYLIRVTTFNTCGTSASQALQVTVDNTAPVGVISSPMECSKWHAIVPIYGTATDAHLASWALQYSDPVTHQWRPIASGNSPVNGKLGEWDTTGLPACAYTLRLIVTDQSRVNMDCSGSAGANQTEYLVSLDLVSDPLAQDTDGDGIRDVWETAHGFNPYDPSDATQDADGDGKTNLEEYLAGTDPRNPGSVLKITAITRQADDALVTWTTVGSHYYLLENANSLTPGSFTTVSPLIGVPPGAPSTLNYRQVGGATAPQRFYRVRLVP